MVIEAFHRREEGGLRFAVFLFSRAFCLHAKHPREGGTGKGVEILHGLGECLGQLLIEEDHFSSDQLPPEQPAVTFHTARPARVKSCPFTFLKEHSTP